MNSNYSYYLQLMKNKNLKIKLLIVHFCSKLSTILGVSKITKIVIQMFPKYLMKSSVRFSPNQEVHF